jgi:hypothetical protein
VGTWATNGGSAGALHRRYSDTAPAFPDRFWIALTFIWKYQLSPIEF